MRGTAVAQRLRCCATNQKFAGSIPAGVIGFFIDIKSFRSHYGELTEMSTRNISWGKGGRCVRLTTVPPSCAVVMKSGKLNFLEPSGPLQTCNGIDLPFYEMIWKNIVEPERPQMTIWRMRIACWIPKATNTHTQFE